MEVHTLDLRGKWPKQCTTQNAGNNFALGLGYNEMWKQLKCFPKTIPMSIWKQSAELAWVFHTEPTHIIISLPWSLYKTE